MSFDEQKTLTEKRLESETIFSGKIITVNRDRITLPNGKEAFREVVRHSGGSAVLCEHEGKILLVRQFRYPYGEILWEIPAGKINSGEPPDQTAVRELEEEGGIKCDKVEKLFETYPSPGYTDEKIYIFRAVGVSFTKQRLDEDEFLFTRWFDKDKLKEMIESGQIKDGKTLIALLYVLK